MQEERGPSRSSQVRPNGEPEVESGPRGLGHVSFMSKRQPSVQVQPRLKVNYASVTPGQRSPGFPGNHRDSRQELRAAKLTQQHKFRINPAASLPYGNAYRPSTCLEVPAISYQQKVEAEHMQRKNDQNQRFNVSIRFQNPGQADSRRPAETDRSSFQIEGAPSLYEQNAAVREAEIQTL